MAGTVTPHSFAYEKNFFWRKIGHKEEVEQFPNFREMKGNDRHKPIPPQMGMIEVSNLTPSLPGSGPLLHLPND